MIIHVLGIRSLDSGEKSRLKETGAQVHTMADIDRHGADRIMKKALAASPTEPTTST